MIWCLWGRNCYGRACVFPYILKFHIQLLVLLAGVPNAISSQLLRMQVCAVVASGACFADVNGVGFAAKSLGTKPSTRNATRWVHNHRKCRYESVLLSWQETFLLCRDEFCTSCPISMDIPRTCLFFVCFLCEHFTVFCCIQSGGIILKNRSFSDDKKNSQDTNFSSLLRWRHVRSL